MDQIISNFYVLIPIAVVIVLRIAGARKKAAAEGQGSLQSPLRQGLSSSVDQSPVEKAAVHKRKTPAPSSGTEPRASAPASGLSPAVDDAVAPVALRNHPPATTAEGFPGNLDRLAPLKRAVAWSEILGKPRGIEPY